MATPLPSNLVTMTLAEVAQATAGALHGPPNLQIRGITTDSRSLRPGALFIALRGANHDGHQYTAQALERGAAAVLCERGRRTVDPCVEVADTQEALGDLARFHTRRIRSLGAVVCFAIGGAAGKTSTKEIAAALARALYGEVLATTGNLNNLIGAPLTVLELRPEHRAMVIECGTNARGEIARLARIVEPDIALVLNVGLEHTEGLGSLEGVADEEAALMKAARVCAVTCVDEPLLMARLPKHVRVVTFGTGAQAMVRLEQWQALPQGRSRITIRIDPELADAVGEHRFTAELGLMGQGSALNATAAVAAMAAARPLALDRLPLLAEALAALNPVAGRLAMRLVDGVYIIDDSYNANPRSVQAALATAHQAADQLGGRLLIALGDMLELGAHSEQAHREVLAQALGYHPALLVVTGPAMAQAADGAAVCQLAADSAEVGTYLCRSARRGDVILVKGSRGMRMERAIEALVGSAESSRTP